MCLSLPSGLARDFLLDSILKAVLTSFSFQLVITFWATFSEVLFIYLSLVIALAKKVDKSTFTSITTPVSDLEVMCEQVGLIVKNLKVLLKRYPPFLPTIPLYQGMTWDPTWKALPTHPLTQRCWVQRLGKSVKQVRNISSCL